MIVTSQSGFRVATCFMAAFELRLGATQPCPGAKKGSYECGGAVKWCMKMVEVVCMQFGSLLISDVRYYLVAVDHDAHNAMQAS